eukprot:CAMPEP_0201120212 /NCGR_PEP_ID=MMETSP0850-20130426/4299_1 /ASSEMBLY_ACC=CAM_ASM_000622 /TAXON_ID=183588 /ORGANISM="Pseudo-nitzschia fraudulenta, Strain WWA7" /LENGTH=47 /DNA_ID= /DNA_START= /DNA_END= /DNA_ORIENTATION=
MAFTVGIPSILPQPESLSPMTASASASASAGAGANTSTTVFCTIYAN